MTPVQRAASFDLDCALAPGAEQWPLPNGAGLPAAAAQQALLPSQLPVSGLSGSPQQPALLGAAHTGGSAASAQQQLQLQAGLIEERQRQLQAPLVVPQADDHQPQHATGLLQQLQGTAAAAPLPAPGEQFDEYWQRVEAEWHAACARDQAEWELQRALQWREVQRWWVEGGLAWQQQQREQQEAWVLCRAAQRRAWEARRTWKGTPQRLPRAQAQQQQQQLQVQQQPLPPLQPSPLPPAQHSKKRRSGGGASESSAAAGLAPSPPQLDLVRSCSSTLPNGVAMPSPMLARQMSLSEVGGCRFVASAACGPAALWVGL